MTKCSAIIQFGDDYGDNHCTFHCQLDEGHSDEHLEIGNMYGVPYRLEWVGDMTEKEIDESGLSLIKEEDRDELPTVMEDAMMKAIRNKST